MNHIFKKNEIEIYFFNKKFVEFFGDSYQNWFHDLEICNFNSHCVYSKSVLEFENYLKKIDNKEILVFAIVINSNEFIKHVGNIAIQNIDNINRSAEISFMTGDKYYWGKGINFISGKFIINHVFKKMNLHRLWGGCVNSNVGMIKLFEKLHFLHEGTLLDAKFLNGKYENVLMYGLLKNEFDIKNKEL